MHFCRPISSTCIGGSLWYNYFIVNISMHLLIFFNFSSILYWTPVFPILPCDRTTKTKSKTSYMKHTAFLYLLKRDWKLIILYTVTLMHLKWSTIFKKISSKHGIFYLFGLWNCDVIAKKKKLEMDGMCCLLVLFPNNQVEKNLNDAVRIF